MDDIHSDIGIADASRTQVEIKSSPMHSGFSDSVTTAARRAHVPPFEPLWDTSQDILMVVSAEGRILHVNTAFTAMLGWSESEATDHYLEELTFPEDRDGMRTALELSASDRTVQRMPLRLLHKNRGTRTLEWTVAAVERDYYLVGCQPKEERKRAAALQETSDVRLQLALEAGAVGAWQWNIQTHESIWSPEMALLHGLRPERGSGTPFDTYLGLIHQDDRALVQHKFQEMMAELNEHRIEYRIVLPGGAIRWIDAHARLIRDENDRPLYLAGICIDITRRKRTEQSLRFVADASAELAKLTDYQTTLDRIAQLAVPRFADWCTVDMLTPDGKIERLAVAHVDPAKVQIAHDLHRRFPPDPAQPGGTWSVLRAGTAEHAPEITDEMLEASIVNPEVLAIIRKLGICSYIGVPLFSMGKPIGVVSFISAESRRLYDEEDLALAEDLARRASTAIENVALYRELKEVDQRKNVFLATLAHELRNPLAPIVNALSIMKSTGTDRRALDYMLSVMDRQIGNLTRLVDDLLDVSRINTGKIELRKERTELSAIVNAAIETSLPHIEAAHHRLVVHLPDTPTEVIADPVRLAQVFANLLNNAARYTSAGGTITLSLECTDTHYLVRIRDNGIGIAPGMLKKIFSLFTQVMHPVENKHNNGLGIGLSLVEGLVELHGGLVEAHSEGADRGSEFVVHLPRPSMAASAADQPEAFSDESPDTDTSPRRVLVVDDNVDAADSTAELLRILGYEAEAAHGGHAALELLARARFDAALIDIGMPLMDGYELAARVRRLEDGEEMRLIALTGWGNAEDRNRMGAAGFDEHWVKPIDIEKLKQV